MSTRKFSDLTGPYIVDPMKHVGFAASLAQQCRSDHMDAEDFMQEAMVGLCVAAKLYDPTVGAFTTYAGYWIRHFLSRSRVKNFRLGMYGSIRLTANAINRLPQFTRRQWFRWEYVLEAIAEKGYVVTLAEMPTLLAYVKHKEISLDAPRWDAAFTHDSGLETRLDFVADDGAEDEIDGGALVEEWRALFERVREKLTPIQRDILDRRLLNADEVMLETIGNEYKLSRERIRQLESVALRCVQLEAMATDMISDRTELRPRVDRDYPQGGGGLAKKKETK